MVECDCATWAVEDLPAAMLGNGHNPRCQHYAPNVGALALLSQLVNGIEEWAVEDGVPDFLWDAYSHAVFVTAGKVLTPVDV